MATDVENITAFFEDAIEVEKEIQHNLGMAQSIFRDVKNHSEFSSLIEQKPKEAQHLLEGCKHFAKAVAHLTFEYARVLEDFQRILNATIEALQKEHGLKIRATDMGATIVLDENEFVYEWAEDMKGRQQLIIDKKQLQGTARDTKKILEQVSELVQFDLHIREFFRQMTDKTHVRLKVLEAAKQIESIAMINDSRLLPNMHLLASWWLKLDQIMENIRRSAPGAKRADKKLLKRLSKLLSGEQKAGFEDKNMIYAKYGLGTLVAIASGAIPGANVVKAMLKVRKNWKKMKVEVEEYEERERQRLAA